jgi:hypothetical protein
MTCPSQLPWPHSPKYTSSRPCVTFLSKLIVLWGGTSLWGSKVYTARKYYLEECNGKVLQYTRHVEWREDNFKVESF